MKYIFVTIFITLFRNLVFGHELSVDSNKYDKYLAARLDTIYNEDQGPRIKLLDAIQKKTNQRIIDSLQSIAVERDKENLKKVNAILAHGWPGLAKIGYKGCQTLFLVIQHADLPTEEKYLPMIRTAAKTGEIPVENLAIFEDRIAMKQGKDQIYGSQVLKVNGKDIIYPIINPDHIDERRKRIGLPPIKTYMQEMHHEWNLALYKRDLPRIRMTVRQMNFD